MAAVAPPQPPAGVLPPRPLRATDDRGGFDCGRPALNVWLQRHAWHNHAEDVSRVNVLCDGAAGSIVGYVSLSASQIERAFLPKPLQRNRPDPVPVTLLGQLATDRSCHGQGHAGTLMNFALTTAWRAADLVGSFGVITHPLDDALRPFYAKWSFVDLPFDPRRAMMVRMKDLRSTFTTI